MFFVSDMTLRIVPVTLVALSPRDGYIVASDRTV